MNPEVAYRIVVLGIGLTLAWAFWKASRPSPQFRIRIEKGVPVPRRGVVTDAFLRRIREVAADHQISSGAIAGYPHGRMIRLRFSREFNSASRQQLRNWWSMAGWLAPADSRTCGGQCS
jgi:hypothetical protein